MNNIPIYFDHAASTPVDPAVLEAMLPWFGKAYANPSAQHAEGKAAMKAVALARSQIAHLIGAEPREIIFTSGATEANNLAIKGVFDAHIGKSNHIITSDGEHKSVLDTVSDLSQKGAQISLLPTLHSGIPDFALLQKKITNQTLLVSIMSGNNETGVINNTEDVAGIIGDQAAIFHTDATQALGKVKPDLNGIDLLSGSAHKFYGPKGVGFLYVRRDNPRLVLHAQITGGGQEGGMRSGTLNVPGIVGMGKAAELAEQRLEEDYKKLSALRAETERQLKTKIPDLIINGDADRLPHITNLQFPGINASELVERVGDLLSISTASACGSATMEPSHVLKAMGLTSSEARSSVRISFGRQNNKEEVNAAVTVLADVIRQIKEGQL